MSDLQNVPHFVLDDDKQLRRTYDLNEYVRRYEKHRVVASTYVNDARVSTIFLGTLTATGALFETVVFNGPHNFRRRRYATYDEAVKGHAQMVEEVSK